MVSHYYELASRYNELVSRYYELASRYNEVVARYYDFVSRYYKLVSRYFEDFFSFFLNVLIGFRTYRLSYKTKQKKKKHTHTQKTAIAAMHGPKSHCTIIHCDAGGVLLIDQ